MGQAPAPGFLTSRHPMYGECNIVSSCFAGWALLGWAVLRIYRSNARL